MSATVQLVNSTEEDAAEIDALGDLKPQVDAAKKLIKNYDDRLKVLRDKHGGGDLEQARAIPGNRHTLELQPANNERVITDIRRLVEILGEDTFFSVAKVGMTDIDKYVPAHLKHEVVEQRRGTTRTSKFNKRG